MMRAEAIHGFDVTASKHGHGLIRLDCLFKRHTYRGPGFAGGAAAHRIHDHEHGTAAGSERGIQGRGRACFFHTVLGQIAAHGDEKLFRIRHHLDCLI